MDAKYINKNYLEETIKDYDNTIVSPIRNTVQTIYDGLNNALGLGLQLNYIKSTSPVNYQNVQQVVFTAGQIGNVWCDTPGKVGTQYYDWNPSTNTLTFSSMTGIVTFNNNMSEAFFNCTYLNQNILIPNGVTNICRLFGGWNVRFLVGCSNLNQNILIPNSVTDMTYAFAGCSNLNQNILIPNSVTNMLDIFINCSNLNQNIFIPNSVTDMPGTFYDCTSLNQNILIPNSVTNMNSTFDGCTSLNQNILIPNSVVYMESAFKGCTSLNQNILIPNSVTNMSGTFQNCNSLNQNILIPNSVTDMSFTFQGCNSLNQPDMYIYSQNIDEMSKAFKFGAHINNIHIPTSVPKDISNYMYNCLVNGNTGITFPAANIFNDLPVDIEQWPPV